MIEQSMIEEALNTNPLSLLLIKDKKVINQLNNLIPYSSAFEIECMKSEEYNEDSFLSIPDIMDVNNDGSEQRYRIPNGIKGIICLYNISYQLKLNSLLNPLSSIHYHVDCTDCHKEIYLLAYKDENINYVLSELDTWLEGETATSRNIGSWFRYNSIQTMEFRLGEMTFDYRLMLKRLIHCNAIVKKFKDELDIPQSTFDTPDKTKLITYYKAVLSSTPSSSRIMSLNKRLEQLSKEELKNSPDVVSTTISQFRNRTHFIN